MELRQLRHFLTLAEHGNYHRAAERLFITPQALSASIAKLEQELGVKLFERGRIGLVPTRYAEALLPRASLVCAEAWRARTELEQMAKSDSGRVVVGVGWFTSQVLAGAAAERFVTAYPALDLTLLEGSSEDLHTRLLRGELDVVLSTPSEHVALAPELESETLWQGVDRVHARAGHPLAGRGEVPLADAAQFPWIVAAGTESRTPRLYSACDEHGLPRPTRVSRTNSVYTVERLLMHGDSLILGGPLPPPFTLPFMQHCISFEVPELTSSYRALLVWRKNPSLSAAATHFADTIRRVFREALPAAR
jgi:DNA-binding transcriptional LysR family regulator